MTEEKFHQHFDALANVLQQYVREHDLSKDIDIVLVGRMEGETALTGNACKPCLARILFNTINLLAEEGTTPYSLCQSAHHGVVGHA